MRRIRKIIRHANLKADRMLLGSVKFYATEVQAVQIQKLHSMLLDGVVSECKGVREWSALCTEGYYRVEPSLKVVNCSQADYDTNNHYSKIAASLYIYRIQQFIVKYGIKQTTQNVSQQRGNNG